MEVNVESAQRQKMAEALPLLRSYMSYRAYVRDWYETKKRSRAGFSFRKFSSVLGLKSPNFMQLVLSGQRNVSTELAEKLCEVMKLKSAERSFFLSLVDFEQARSPEDVSRAEKLLLVARKRLVTSHIDRAREKVVSEWYHLLVRELVFLPKFQPTGAFVSRALNDLITEEEGTESLKLLVETGFLVLGTDGKWCAQDVAVDTGDFIFTRASMEKHHGDTLVAWGKNLATLNPKEQELGLLHIPIASDKIEELRQRVRRFQDEIIGWLCEEKNPDRVVQLGTYIIPFDIP